MKLGILIKPFFFLSSEFLRTMASHGRPRLAMAAHVKPPLKTGISLGFDWEPHLDTWGCDNALNNIRLWGPTRRGPKRGPTATHGLAGQARHGPWLAIHSGRSAWSDLGRFRRLHQPQPQCIFGNRCFNVSIVFCTLMPANAVALISRRSSKLERSAGKRGRGRHRKAAYHTGLWR